MNLRTRISAWRDLAKLVALIVALWLLGGTLGCSTIDMHKAPPADWPIKQVNTYRVDFRTMSDACQCYAPFGSIYMACTYFYFDQGKAEIWLWKGTAEQFVKHEELHAFLGRDHLGDDRIERTLVDWRAGRTTKNSCKMPARMDEYRKLPFTVEYTDRYMQRMAK